MRKLDVPDSHPKSAKARDRPATATTRKARFHQDSGMFKQCWLLPDDHFAVLVDPYLRSDTEAGQLRALFKAPRSVRAMYTAFRLVREETGPAGRWFVFRGFKEG